MRMLLEGDMEIFNEAFDNRLARLTYKNTYIKKRGSGVILCGLADEPGKIGL